MELIAEQAVLTAVAPGSRDRLLTFLTRGHGGVRLYARRQARRPSEWVFLDPLQGGELVFLRPREGGLARLHSFVPQRVWPGIRADLGRTMHALGLLELLNAMLTEGEPQPQGFELLVRFLNRLETEDRPGLARIAASLRLLEQGGFAPSLETCPVCGCAIGSRGGALFSPEAGGVVCPACRAGERLDALPVSAGCLGFLVRLVKLTEGQSRRLRVAPGIEREASRLLDAFVEARTGVRQRCGRAIERLEAG